MPTVTPRIIPCKSPYNSVFLNTEVQLFLTEMILFKLYHFIYFTEGSLIDYATELVFNSGAARVKAHAFGFGI